MRNPATPSVDQLRVLLTVVEAGSFTAAAKRLGRATSAISYAIDTLEEQLGIVLFERGRTRKPQVTQRGEAVVAEAKAVVHSIEVLRARVKGLLDELEPEVSLVIDNLFPHDRYVTLLRDFHAEFPTVPVRLLTRSLGGVETAVRSGVASIGVAGRLHIDRTGLRYFDIVGVPIIPVAAPSHPLASSTKAIQSRVRDFVQLVLSEQPAGAGRDNGVVSLNTWRVGDVTAKHQLLLGGIGWGGMPEPMVRDDIKSGRLVRLKLRDYRGGIFPMEVVHMADTPPGPAGQWLIERLMALPVETEANVLPETASPKDAKRRRRSPKRTTPSRTK